jgi:hypothetical protein
MSENNSQAALGSLTNRALDISGAWGFRCRHGVSVQGPLAAGGEPLKSVTDNRALSSLPTPE